MIADVTVAGAAIDADALAQSFVHSLRAYRLIGTSSQLISIDSTTGAATHIGSALANRTMRAAAFDALGRLWVVDAANNVLMRIDPTTGAVLGSAIPLTLGMSAFSITGAGSDIAFAANGTAVLVDSSSVYSLNTATGAVALLFQDSALRADMSPVFHVGAAFVAGVGGGWGIHRVHPRRGAERQRRRLRRVPRPDRRAGQRRSAGDLSLAPG